MMSDPSNPPGAPDEQPVTAEIVQRQTVPTPAGSAPARGPWGFWPTVGFSVVIVGTFFVVQTAVAIPFVLVEMQRPGAPPAQELTEHLESNGLLLSLATLLSAPVCTALTVLLARIRRGISVAEYLGLRGVGGRTMVTWGLLVAGFMVVSDGLTYLAGRDVVPSQMVRAYQTAGFLPLLWLAIICLAPMFEEIFFRGFLFAGIRHSRLGATGAIVVSALCWAGIHMQYDFYQVSTIFAGGLVLGAARLRTGSVWLTIGLHALWNLIAMVETAVVAG